MKLWGLAVAGLYLVVLLLLTIPVTYLALDWPKDAISAETFRIFREWGYWIWLAFMLTGALLLLFVPVQFTEKRPKSRRPLLVPILTTGLLVGILCYLGGMAISVGIWGDDGILIQGEPPFAAWLSAGLPIILLWCIWGRIFYSASQTYAPEAVTHQAAAWLLKGSILEFLVALVCHVIVRRRDDCCAPGVTFLGIATGLAIMLMSFGPGVFFSFAARFRRLQPRDPTFKSHITRGSLPSIQPPSDTP